MSTPLRDLNPAGSGGGLVTLAGSVTPSVDARVRRLRRLLKNAAAVPSWDPRLVPRAETGLDTLEVEPGCANLVRSLDLDPGSAVLQLGASTGLLTRYLAETVAVVDALEPNVHLAEIAAARVSELTAARVFSGTLADVPDAPTYDVIVAVDALRDGVDHANAFIEQTTRRLAPGGSLVLAETNRLGVKYLVGAPDDLTADVFDGIEGYPAGAPHPALTRHELDGVLAASGLNAKVLLALPHHREVRALVDPERLLPSTANLPFDLSPSPSPDIVGSRPKLADETAVWQQAVKAGLAEQLANSFVVLATVTGESRLWPKPRVASFHSWRRSAPYTSNTTIDQADSGPVVRREYPKADPNSEFAVVNSETPFIAGRALIDVLADRDDDGRAQLLGLWRALVEVLAAGGSVWLDMHPGNVVLTDHGALAPIDLEYGSATADAETVVRRGLLVAGRALALRQSPASWTADFAVLGDVVRYLGTLAGLDSDENWLANTLDDEAEFQRSIAGTRGTGRSLADWRADLAILVETPLSRLPLGDRAFDDLEPLAAERDEALTQLGIFDTRIRELEEHEAALVDNNELLVDGLADRDQQIAHWTERSTNLSAHIESLEDQLASERAAAVELEIALRNEIHHRHLAFIELQSSRSEQDVGLTRHTVATLLPAGTRRRRFVAIVTRPFRRG